MVAKRPNPDPADRLVGLLGLGLRGGKLAIGVDATRASLQRGGVHVVVMAADASARAVDKISRLASAKSVPVLRGPVADRLGERLGRPPVMAVGVRDRSLATGLVGLGES